MNPISIEILTIGDELMTGNTLDTNAAHISRELTGAGYNVKYRSTVGDDVEEMIEAMRLALKRADVVITTGGLGPTDDDLTKRALVKVFRRNLIFHEEIVAELKARFQRRGMEMPAINQNQALLPQGATAFPNTNGSAVGICLTESNHTMISLPGVPEEMKQILNDSVLPHLKTLRGRQPIAIIKIRTTGIFESQLAEMIMPGLRPDPGVKLAYLPSQVGVDLRIIARGADDHDAEQKAKRLAQHIESLCGKYVYGHDDETLEAVVGRLLMEKFSNLSVAESCTGGALGALITSVPGSSTWFMGGVIAYDNNVKISALDVPRELIELHGAVSEQCAKAMAGGCRKRFATNYALAVTGIAGPDGGSDDKPVGTTFVALAGPEKTTVRKSNLGLTRPIVRARAAQSALEMLRRELMSIV